MVPLPVVAISRHTVTHTGVMAQLAVLLDASLHHAITLPYCDREADTVLCLACLRVGLHREGGAEVCTPISAGVIAGVRAHLHGGGEEGAGAGGGLEQPPGHAAL